MTVLPCHLIWNPEMSPFSFLGFEIRYYSLCWMIGLALGYFIMQWLYKQQKVNEKLFEPLFIYCFIGILVGARLGHCIFDKRKRISGDAFAAAFCTRLMGVAIHRLPRACEPRRYNRSFYSIMALLPQNQTKFRVGAR